MRHPLPFAQSGRDLRLDVLRGLCVFAMIVDHVAGPSPLYIVTGGNRFLTSAAEGFILISGLTAGVVYRRLVARDGLSAAAVKALRRAFSLYLLAVGLALAIAPVSELFGLPGSQGLDLSQPWRFVAGVLTLHQTYYLADAMLLYTLLLALLPASLWLLERGHAAPLLAASAGLWLLHQISPELATVTWPIAGNYLFTFSAWQFLFFGALVLGYRADRLPKPTPTGERLLHGASAAALALLVGLYFLLRVPASGLPARLDALRPGWDTLRAGIELQLFAKADLGPGRVLAAVVLFAFLFLSLTRWWNWLARPARLALPLGQNALYAFTLHTVLAVLAPLALILLDLPRDAGWLNAGIQVAAVTLITLLAGRQILTPTKRTRPVWQAAPFALAAVALVVLPVLPFPTRVAALPPIDEEVLARARAYGTPVTELPAAAAVWTPAPEPSRVQPTPTLAPATIRTSRKPARATPAEALPAPAETRPATRSAALANSPTPAATPTPTPTPTPEILDDELAPGADGLPPLPPDEQRVQSDYISVLAGSAYDRAFFSEILRRDMRYWVYLPPGYAETARRYPVVYMLHGGGGQLDEWAAYGLIGVADRAFYEGQLRPFIIVLPQGDKSYWANWTENGPRWGDYLAYDVVWEIDSNFATVQSARARVVAGNSMGGFGALHQAFTHPDIFGGAAAHSPSLYMDEGALAFLGTGEEYASKDPLALSLLLSPDLKLQLWLDTGDDDPWEPRTAELHERLDQRQVAHEWRVYPGIHGPEYWATHVPEYLLFYAAAFAGR